ncbi:MAG: OmpA family protein [Pseudomonadota bacterium]
MKLKSTLFATAAVFAVSTGAHAYEGLYGAIGAGLSYLDREVDVSNDSVATTAPFLFDTSADYDSGIGVYGALGYAFGDGFRTELEVSYRNNDISAIDPDGPGFTGFTGGTATGDSSALGILLNVIYDFEGLHDVITPYIGAGVGIANVDHSIIAGPITGSVPTNPMSITYGADKWVAAYQGIAGVSVDLAEGLLLDVSYRYFATDPTSFTGTINGGAQPIKAEYRSHTAFAGLRWLFGPQEAAVQYQDCWDGSSVPVTAECPPQIVESSSALVEPIDFVVYFDYDKSNLTPQASTLIAEAASRALANDIETVVVEGHTDTSGGSAYNEALSQRRAAAVRNALIANGVSADSIRVETYGETAPAKPTADGVREPLNRRSEVSISFE